MSVTTLEEPEPGIALAELEGAIDRGELVTLYGRCTVEYEGRAASYLEPGARHVMLKPDGTVLVHTDEGQQPVNWQPPGCTHEPVVEDDQLVVRSHRSTPEEELTVRFGTLEHVATFAGEDTAEITLSGTEEDLRRRLLETPSLIEDGFEPLATERETAAGAVDLFGRDANGATVVVELKRRRVGPDAVGQLGRYVEALRRELHADATLRGILVAPSVTDRARRLLAERGLEFVPVGPEVEAPESGADPEGVIESDVEPGVGADIETGSGREGG